MARFEVSPAVIKLVRKRFQNSCVVCGKTDFTDIAHIYEDATKRAATSDRLVLLCPSDNQAQQRSHAQSAPDLPKALQPTNLLAAARADYWEGLYARGYGKARLAAYVYEKQEAYSDAVDSLTEAISAMRPLRWGDWLGATTCEAERLCLSYEVGVARRWLLLDRVALVLFDYGRWSESAEVLSAATQLRDAVTGDSYDPQRLQFDKQAAFRRASLIKGLTGQLNKGEKVPDLLEELEEQASELLKKGKFDSFATHLDVARSLSINRGNREEAHEYSEEVLDLRSKVSHKWVLLEHLVGEAEYFSYKNDPKRALYYATEAMSLFNRHPAALEPILESTPKPLGIHERIQRLGITETDLISARAPIAPSVDEVRFTLSKADVIRAVRSVLTSRAKRTTSL
jgi:tetratricopeptide (TPR) repeat protein